MGQFSIDCSGNYLSKDKMPTTTISNMPTPPSLTQTETRTSNGFIGLVIVMVGLPARGKTYIANKLARYLKWIGFNPKVFNAGNYRRDVSDEKVKKPKHDFFDPNNTEAKAIREQCMEAALVAAIGWLKTGDGYVAIFDATNTTKERRQHVFTRIVLQNELKCMFLESICTSDKIVESNVREVKIHSPDYKGVEATEAITDFWKRIQHYENIYEPISEETEGYFTFIKIFNAGEKYVINRCEGYLQSKLVYWITNVHITRRTIYLTRHGESRYDVLDRIGGNSSLTARGEEYAEALSEYFSQLDTSDLTVWTSFMERTIQTSAKIGAPQIRWHELDELDAGKMENMTYEQLRNEHPDEYAARLKNKLTYRYPSGESYRDLIARLEPVIMNLERQGNILIVAHQAVLRCILGYFQEQREQDLPYLTVPLHTLIKLTPQAYGCEIEFISL